MARSQLARLRLRLLDAWALAAREVDPDVAEHCLRLGIMADPADEARYLALTELFAARGRKGAALEVLERARLWAAEMGLEVSPAIRSALSHLTGKEA